MVTGTAGGAPQQGMSNTLAVSSMSPPGAGTLEPHKRVGSEHRRSNKPIMEKRRRARINNCLNDLKTLILDAMKKDPARHSKLEKADILEMTVKHLETLQRQRACAGEPAAAERFRAGFHECAAEVGRYPGLEPALRRRLLQHLAACVTPAAARARPPTPPTPPAEPDEPSGIFISAGGGAGVRLVPTRLANGDIALVLPAHCAAGLPGGGALPTLVPIPCRTPSTASASSSSSAAAGGGGGGCYSPVSSAAWSPSPPPCSPAEPAPLSLVTRRELPYHDDGDDKPWRPW